ncbi:MAG TPA: hypothetical protein VJH97_02225 [Candidatus Nanoarchaeia archaeon]|nr:hypothetical protein [Candidatus Nanoarchaeia archaeon]
MQKLKILNKKELRTFFDILEKIFGYTGKLDFVFLLSEKNKVYLVNKEIEGINLQKLRVNSYGMYIAEWREHEVRLSIEGSQLVGPFCSKNVLEVDTKTAREWLKGVDIDYNGELEGFVIIKNGDDHLGSGRVVPGKILNYVSKVRRLHCSD